MATYRIEASFNGGAYARIATITGSGAPSALAITSPAASAGGAGFIDALYDCDVSGQADIPISVDYTAGSAASASGTLSAQAVGDGTLTVRFEEDHAVSDTALVAIGEVDCAQGDSVFTNFVVNEAGAGTTPRAYVWLGYEATNRWRRVDDPGWPSIWLNYLKQRVASTGRPCGVIHTAVGGTDLMGGWDAGTSSHQGNWTDSRDICAAAIAANGTNRVRHCLVHLNPNGVGPAGSYTAAQLATAYEHLSAGNTASITGAPSTFLAMFCNKPATAWASDPTDPDYRVQMDLNRSAALLAWAGTLGAGPNLVDLVYTTDEVHPDDVADCTIIGRRLWAAVDGYRGPRASTPQIDSARTTVTVPVGSTISNTGVSVGGFRVMDNGVAVTISGATTASGSIALALAAPIAGVCTVSFGSGRDASGQTVPLGASITLPDGAGTIALPLEPFIAAIATVQSSVAWRSV